MRFLRGALLALALIAAGSSIAAAQKLDGIAAVVNDDVVLESDIEEQLFLFLQSANTRPDSAQVDSLRKQILEQLINERLLVAEAKKQNLAVTDAEVERRVSAAIEEAKKRLGGEAALSEQLQRENMTIDKLRDKYRADMRRSMLLEKVIERSVPKRNVPASEAEAYFKANPARFPRVPAELRLSVIQIPVRPDSASDTKGRAAAIAARKRILAGEKFAKVAAEVSDDPNSARSGGDLGFFTSGTMEPALEQMAFGLKLNEVSQPLRTPYGWHIVETLERDTLKTRAGRDSLRNGKPVLEAHVRHILIRVPLDDDDIERARKLAEKLHGDLEKGADFTTMVKRYSQYEGPAGENGDLGMVNVGGLQPAIRAGLEPLKVGEISDPLPNSVGFNIFKVVDKKPERPYALEEVREELPRVVAELKFRDRLEEYTKTLRSKASVQIR